MSVAVSRTRKSTCAGGTYDSFTDSAFSLRLLCSTLEGSASQVSEQGLRKALYQKILAAFPEGWMSSGQVSREGEQQWTMLAAM